MRKIAICTWFQEFVTPDLILLQKDVVDDIFLQITSFKSNIEAKDTQTVNDKTTNEEEKVEDSKEEEIEKDSPLKPAKTGAFGGWNRIMDSMKSAIQQKLFFGAKSTPPKPKKRKFETEDDDDDKENDVLSQSAKKRIVSTVKNLTVDQITDDMIREIPTRPSGKIRPTTDEEKARASTCHQCRQKTLDLKSICRQTKTSKECRYRYCVFCLKNIYGQDLKVILKDPNWACPMCQGNCECSVCKRRKGEAANGNLTLKAKSKGFDSVVDYIAATQNSE